MAFLYGFLGEGVTSTLKMITRLQPARKSGAKQQILAVNTTLPLTEVSIQPGSRALSFSSELQLTVQQSDLGLSIRDVIRDAVWDSFSSSLIILTDTAVMRVTTDNVIQLLAGHNSESGVDDGVGCAARFDDPIQITSDGAGSLYVADESCIRKVQLPASWEGKWPYAAADASTAGDIGQVTVSTLDIHETDQVRAVACIAGDNGPGSLLLYATDHALYRVALKTQGSTTTAEIVLFAGHPYKSDGGEDGQGAQARFKGINGFTVDAEGNIILADGEDDECRIRMVTPSGKVTTVVPRIRGSSLFGWPTILPNGFLSLMTSDALCFIDMGLKATPVVASAAPPVEPPRPSPARTLPGDLGDLLDRQPDGTSDVKVVVGDRTFPAHRTILSARSDYFRQRLAGHFADGSAQQLNLPDADPDAFALVLRFLYTGDVDIPAALAAAVAELADRLLLPELCREAQARVLAEVRPETAVDRMLWAEDRGHSFSGLAADLKAWCLEHNEEVVARAPDSVKWLMTQSPDAAMELFVLGKRARGCSEGHT